MHALTAPRPSLACPGLAPTGQVRSCVGEDANVPSGERGKKDRECHLDETREMLTGLGRCARPTLIGEAILLSWSVRPAMPTYEYRCLNCKKRVSVYLTYEEYGRTPAKCPTCGSADLQRLISRVRVARSEDSRLESLSDPASWGDIDEEDPRSMARLMRRMGQEMGEELPPEFNEVVDRLEAGQSPEEIEESMPELGASGAEAEGDTDFDE